MPWRRRKRKSSSPTGGEFCSGVLVCCCVVTEQSRPSFISLVSEENCVSAVDSSLGV